MGMNKKMKSKTEVFMSLSKEYRRITRIPYKYIPTMILAYFSINVLGLVLPLIMKKIYGSVIISKSMITLQMLLSAALVALIFEVILKKAKDSSSKWIASVYEYQLSNYLVEKILNSYDLSHKRNYISDLEKFSSISSISSFYATALYQLFIDLPFAMAYLYLIYIFGRTLVLVPIGLALLYVIVVAVLTSFYKVSRKAEIEYTDAMLNRLTETLEKIHFVKATGLEASQIRGYKEILKKVTESNYSSNKFESIYVNFSSNYSQLLLFAILIVGGYLMQAGVMTFGEVTACAMLGSRSISPIIHVMGNFKQLNEIKLLKKRIEALVERPNQYGQDIPSFPEDIEGTIELLNLKYSDIQTNEDKYINCMISKGNFVCISPRDLLSYKRILRQVYGADMVVEGKILIDNLDISKWNMNTLKGKLEYITSPIQIVKGTVLENITFYDASKSQNAYIASSLTGLDELVQQMPEGYESPLDSYSINQLSTAFLQRLNLARAFVDRPRVLIIDRVDEGMDHDTMEHFIWLLKHLKDNTTLIVVSEHPEIHKLATHILTENGLSKGA